jgi:amino acid transporter
MRDVISRAFARKPLSVFDAETQEEKLSRDLGLFDLLCIGVGGTLGSGIFVLTGLISKEYAGPGAVYSWLIAGLCTSLSAMAYAEMSARIPSCGSAYAYAYCALGELPALCAASYMTLEYGLSGWVFIVFQ